MECYVVSYSLLLIQHITAIKTTNNNNNSASNKIKKIETSFHKTTIISSKPGKLFTWFSSCRTDRPVISNNAAQLPLHDSALFQNKKDRILCFIETISNNLLRIDFCVSCKSLQRLRKFPFVFFLFCFVLHRHVYIHGKYITYIHSYICHI